MVDRNADLGPPPRAPNPRVAEYEVGWDRTAQAEHVLVGVGHSPGHVPAWCGHRNVAGVVKTSEPFDVEAPNTFCADCVLALRRALDRQGVRFGEDLPRLTPRLLKGAVGGFLDLLLRRSQVAGLDEQGAATCVVELHDGSNYAVVLVPVVGALVSTWACTECGGNVFPQEPWEPVGENFVKHDYCPEGP